MILDTVAMIKVNRTSGIPFLYVYDHERRHRPIRYYDTPGIQEPDSGEHADTGRAATYIDTSRTYKDAAPRQTLEQRRQAMGNKLAAVLASL